MIALKKQMRKKVAEKLENNKCKGNRVKVTKNVLSLLFKVKYLRKKSLWVHIYTKVETQQIYLEAHLGAL